MTLHRHGLDRPGSRKMLERCHFSEIATLNQMLLGVGHALGLCLRHESTVAVSWTHVLHSIRLVKTKCAVLAHEHFPRCE